MLLPRVLTSAQKPIPVLLKLLQFIYTQLLAFTRMAHGWGVVVGGAGPVHKPAGAQAQGGHCQGHRRQSKG